MLQGEVATVLDRLNGPYDRVLMAPPYRDPFPVPIVERFASSSLLAPEGQVVVGHPSRVPPPTHSGDLPLVQDRRYGDSSLAFYERESGERAR